MHSETQNQSAQDAPKLEGKFGSIIKKAREAAQLSHTDLADKLNLSAQTVEWLEREQFDKLPAATFVRGYIRSIAIHLSLDPQQLLDAYRQKGYDQEPQLVSTSNRISSPNFIINFALIFRVIGTLLLIAALATLGWYGFSYFKQNRAQNIDNELSLQNNNNHSQRLNISDTNRLTLSIDAEQTLPQLHSLDMPASDTTAQNEPEASTQVQLPDLAPKPAEPASNAADNTSNESDTKNTASKQAIPENQLTLSAAENAWVSIIDGNNKVLLQGTIGSNDGTRSFVAVPPVRLHLGNAHKLTLNYRGKEVDLSQFITSNNVAKLSLK